MKIRDSGSFSSLHHHSCMTGQRTPIYLVEEVSQQTLPRDLRQAIAFESQTVPAPLCSTIFHLFLSLHVRKNCLGYDSFDLNSNANLSHLSIFYRFLVVRYEITIYRKLFSVYPFFLNATNLLYVNNYYSSSCIKRNFEIIESLINKGISIHADFNEIFHNFSSI